MPGNDLILSLLYPIEHDRLDQPLGLDPVGRWQAWRRRSIGLRGAWLYLLATPLALASVVALARGELALLLADAAALALVAAGARSCRRGLREELLRPARRFTRASRVPFKLLGGLAVAGYHLGYGLGSARGDGGELPPPLSGRLREVVETAERQILAIELAAATVGQAELQARLSAIAGKAREIVELIVERPDELSRARRFLSVYLEGAERVASRYARIHPIDRSRQLEDRFRRVLAGIEQVFGDQHERLRRHDLTDLDVQITVLRRQLEQEGL